MRVLIKPGMILRVKEPCDWPDETAEVICYSERIGKWYLVTAGNFGRWATPAEVAADYADDLPNG